MASVPSAPSVPPAPRQPHVMPARRAVRFLLLTDGARAAAAGHDLIDVVSATLSCPPVGVGDTARPGVGARSVARQRMAHPEGVAGPTGVVLREKHLPVTERAALARRLRHLTAVAGVALIVAGDAGLATAVGADGLHLAAGDRWPGGAAGDPGPGGGAGPVLLGRSCHTLAEVRAAAAEGADYVTYSPVFATASKPGYGPAVGLDGLAAACDAAGGAGDAGGVPVVALGGIGPGRAGTCLRAGASGVAVMGEVMRAGDPGAVARALAVEIAGARTAGAGGAGG